MRKTIVAGLTVLLMAPAAGAQAQRPRRGANAPDIRIVNHPLHNQKYILSVTHPAAGKTVTLSASPLRRLRLARAADVCAPVGTFCVSQIRQRVDDAQQNGNIPTAPPLVPEDSDSGPIADGNLIPTADPGATTTDVMAEYQACVANGGGSGCGYGGHYGCYSQEISRTESQWGFYQWGITLDKQWCGYAAGRITSQDKQLYISTGSCWGLQSSGASTRMVNRGHGRSEGHARFRYSCWFISQEESGQVGLDFYGSGYRTTWKN